jgi:hypothetical protein
LDEGKSMSAVTYHPVIVKPEPKGQFTAEPLGVPELRVVASSPQEALEKVQQALPGWGGALHWVPVSSVPPAAGHAKDDPEFAAYLEEIERYRREVDSRDCPNSSSTQTT